MTDRRRAAGDFGAGPWSSNGDQVGRWPAEPEVDLVVLVNGFPRLSETFVLQELLDLERRGLRLLVLALSRPNEVVRQEALCELRARVEYVPEKIAISRLRVARAHGTMFFHRGLGYGVALGGVARCPEATVGVMKRAVAVASRLVALGSPPLYIHFAHKPATIGRMAARLAGVPYALSCHAKDIWLTPPDELAAKVRGAEVVLVCTADGKEELERHAAGATPVQLAYHGIDVNVVPVRRAATGPPRILSVGRLVDKKGHDLLIRAAALLRDRDVSFTLRIAGDGIEWARLQRLVHELDLSAQVTFLGPLSSREVEAEYESATVFGLACRHGANGDRDGLPNVVLEAMARELPVVSTTQGAAAEAVDHPRTGLLVAPEDPEALASSFEKLLRSPRTANEIGRAARMSIRERFDRERLLPTVAAALTDAGLITPSARHGHEGDPATPERKAA
jgi:glycosyltransferase involved in cell wall biosynthesis